MASKWRMGYKILEFILFTTANRPSLYTVAGFKHTGVNLTIDGKPWPFLSATGKEYIEGLSRIKRAVEQGDEYVLDEIKSAATTSLGSGSNFPPPVRPVIVDQNGRPVGQ